MPVYRGLSASKDNARDLHGSPNQSGDARPEAERLAQGTLLFLPQKEGIEVKQPSPALPCDSLFLEGTLQG